MTGQVSRFMIQIFVQGTAPKSSMTGSTNMNQELSLAARPTQLYTVNIFTLSHAKLPSVNHI